MEPNIAEFEFLSLVITYNEFLGRTILKKEYFEEKNMIMFEILKDAYDKDKTLVLSKLFEHKNFDSNYYLELMQSNLYHSAKEKHFKLLEKKIIEQYKARELQRIINAFGNKPDEFYKRTDALRELNVQSNEYINSQDMIKTLEEENAQVKLGFKDLDKSLYISQNDFVILAGGTGTGKTTFALNLLSNLSKEYQCVYFNMEMSKKTLYKRLCAIESSVDITKFNDFNNMDPKEMKLVYSKIDEIESRKIILINGSQNIDEIEKTIASISDERKLVVILDHIGLINSYGNSLYEKMTYTAKKIRGMCLDYNCTIFGLCQLSRDSQKEERQPKLQDLRDSGEIEQSARKVLLLYNKDFNKQIDIKNVELLVAKNDDGSFMLKDLKFNTKKQKFNEVYNE